MGGQTGPADHGGFCIRTARPRGIGATRVRIGWILRRAVHRGLGAIRGGATGVLAQTAVTRLGGFGEVAALGFARGHVGIDATDAIGVNGTLYGIEVRGGIPALFLGIRRTSHEILLGPAKIF